MIMMSGQLMATPVGVTRIFYPTSRKARDKPTRNMLEMVIVNNC